ncbi:phage terminase small subunit [Wohlfahrtiimonas larvae]|uniref:Phage terminase small subunit n=1 Tax=Wohlfahrtiimonas larvae TaxID=1157986 RepID=A0ABP9MMT2_9GAMM|nr:phage terminase small subunit [Wohlfahrtiimonas larvae]
MFLFKREKARKLAAKLDEHGDLPTSANPAHLNLLTRLKQDLSSLRAILSFEEKERFKAEHLDDYRPWVEGILDNQDAPEDKITSEMFIWAVDAGEIELALRIATYLMENNYELPPIFKTNKAGAITEQIVNRALNNKADITLDHLITLNELMADADMLDAIRAKLNRAIGELSEESNPQFALAVWQRALELDPDVGIKTRANKLEAALKKQEEQSQPEVVE